MLGNLTIQRLLQKMKECAGLRSAHQGRVRAIVRVASKAAPGRTRRCSPPTIRTSCSADRAGSTCAAALESARQRRFFASRGWRANAFAAACSAPAAACMRPFAGCPRKCPHFEQLASAAGVSKSSPTAAHEGLIIVCGVTGSGKSSTLAAMIDHINKNRQCNISRSKIRSSTPSSPKLSYFSQREIGIDVADFRRRPAQRRATRSRRDDDRRVARPRNGAGRNSSRRNRPPGVRHAAHGRHHAGVRPHAGVFRRPKIIISFAPAWRPVCGRSRRSG